jgi:hypothetical protein
MKCPLEKRSTSPATARGTLHHAIRTLTYLRRRFATGAAVSEQLPVWTFSQDLGRAQPLIFAIVPFHKIGIGFRNGCEPRQFAGSHRTLQRAGKYLCDLQAFQPFPKAPRMAFTVRGQGQVGKTGVLARNGPCGVTVPRQVNNRK